MATAFDLIRASNGQATTPNLADPSLQDFLDEAADMGAKRCDDYLLHREFYEGDHGTELTDRLREFLEVKGVRFTENFCEPVVDMIAERLVVQGFEAKVEGDEEGERGAELSGWLDDAFWQAGRMDETQGTVHTNALALGDAFGIIGFDNEAGRPTFDFNWPNKVKIVYEDEHPDRKQYAVKVWHTNEMGPSNPAGRRITRMNLYWPDRIERYFKLHSSAGKGGWSRWLEPVSEDGEPAPWPTPWIDESGEPLGIPVVHFRNRARGRTYGRSELCGVIPQQLLLTKQVLDLATILDNQGWSQRWVSGVDPSTTSLKNVPGEVWATPSKEAAFGQFATADIEPVLAAIEATLSRIARRSGMPLHLLTTGDMPSGESMKAAESRLVARCKDRGVSFGNAWEDAAAMAHKLAAMAGVLPPGVPDPQDVTLSVLWVSPESRDDLAEATTAEAHLRLGVSKHTLLLKLGYDPDEEADRRKGEAEEAAAKAAMFFDGGSESDDEGDAAGGRPPQFGGAA